MKLPAMTVTPPAGIRERVNRGGTIAGRSKNLASLLAGALRRWPLVVVLLVAAGFAAACLREAWLDSPTVDEPVYVAAGILGAVHQDLTFNEEHPPLPKVIAALPVLADRPHIPRGWSQVSGHRETTYAERFIDAQIASGKLRTVTFLSRLVPILEAIAVGLVLYRLGALLYGPAAGAIAGVLWLANPLTMGLGHLDGIDLPMALATALTSLALLRWHRRRDRGSVVLAGVAAGAAGAAGPAGLVVIAVAVSVVVAASWRGHGWRALISGGAVMLTAVAVIWVSYAVLDPRVVLHPGLVLPQPYIDGLRYLKAHDSNGYGYLLGVQWLGHRWWYWPGSLLVKTPLPTLVILVAGSLAVAAIPRPARGEVLLVIVLPALALTAFTLFIPPDTGIRYLLPAIALLIVVASGVVVVARGYIGRAVLAALVTISVVMAASSFPHSIAWTTPPFTPAYQFVSGTNLDWGQDFYLLRQWSRGRHPYIDVHGAVALAPFGARPLLGTDPGMVTGWVAVSGTFLTGRGNSSPAWLRSYCPVGTIGGSILVYDFGRPPGSSSPGPARPAGLCQDSRYSHLAAASAQRLRCGRPDGWMLPV
jgi:4-amino-4-deoxy-L-arabinose transferase-like glycosyltransferase